MKRFNKSQVGEVLQEIYNSEINIELTSFWDGGYDYRLGDSMNGYKDVHDGNGNFPAKLDYTKIEDTISAMAYFTYRNYPSSKFAMYYEGL